ncbi:hypothetical protein KIPB_003386, partial [Kipferlia bialata]
RASMFGQANQVSDEDHFSLYTLLDTLVMVCLPNAQRGRRVAYAPSDQVPGTPEEPMYPELMEACIGLMSNLYSGPPVTFLDNENLFGYTMLYSQRCGPRWIVRREWFGKGRWQPKEFLLAMARCTEHLGVGYSTRAEFCAYLLDPARHYDVSNRPAMAQLIGSMVSCGGRNSGPFFVRAAEGHLAEYIETLEDTKQLVKVCYSFTEYFLNQAGSVNESVYQEMAMMPGPRVHGVSSALVDTLTLCRDKCRDNGSDEAHWVTHAVATFLSDLHSWALPPNITAVTIPMPVELNLPLFRAHECVTVGENCAILLGTKNSWGPYDNRVLAYMATLNETSASGLDIQPIDATCQGITSAVCMGGKVYVYAGGAPPKYCDSFESRPEISMEEDPDYDYHNYGEEEEEYPPTSVHVYSLDTREWEGECICGEEGPDLRYPRGMVAVSDTEFVLVVGHFTINRGKPLEAWLCDTESMRWKRLASPPPPQEDCPPTDDYYRRTVYGMGMLGSRLHLTGGAMEYSDCYHCALTLPSEAEPEGEWTVLGNICAQGFQSLGDHMGLALTETGVHGYDALRNQVGRELLSHALHVPDETMIYDCVSCALNKDTVLAMIVTHPDLEPFSEETGPTLAMLLSVDTDALRDTCVLDRPYDPYAQ